MKSTDGSIASLVETCKTCAKVCYDTAAKCKDMEGMEDCYNACINCAEACEKVVVDIGVNADYLLTAVDQCAHVCSGCATECAKHDNNHCQECSEICLKCAELCSAILGKERNPA